MTTDKGMGDGGTKEMKKIMKTSANIHQKISIAPV
jgi:hypothetical protein